jgi:hypothetical protein
MRQYQKTDSSPRLERILLNTLRIRCDNVVFIHSLTHSCACVDRALTSNLSQARRLDSNWNERKGALRVYKHLFNFSSDKHYHRITEFTFPYIN